MERILEVSKNVTALEGYFPYGTAGFRTLGTRLAMVAFKAGLVALQRAASMAQFTGIMVTASHNPIQDNGMKMVDCNGEMLPADWELYVEQFVNGELSSFSEAFTGELRGTVFIGYDTRPTSVGLVENIKLGITAAGGSFHDYGLVTTPQLHYLVKRSNEAGTVQPLSRYFDDFNRRVRQVMQDGAQGNNYELEVVVDAAGGVGGIAMKDIQIPGLTVTVINVDSEFLNANCGSDYVFRNSVLPTGGLKGKKSASFDGDADRLIYYKEDESFKLLGGDKLTVLYAAVLKKLGEQDKYDLPINVVTTAYTNNACVNYLKDLGISVTIVATGVKHLHHAAKEHPLSIYFEANGHGTIVVSAALLQELSSSGCAGTLGFLSLSNDTVGDAIADLLLAEVALKVLDWSVDDWYANYVDFPGVLIGTDSSVKDEIKTSPDETTVTAPQQVVEAIERLKEEYAGSHPKVVVRPSGTEPIVRIYVEALDKRVCEEMGEKLTKILE